MKGLGRFYILFCQSFSPKDGARGNKNFGNKSFRLDGMIRPTKTKLIVIKMSIAKVFRAANHTDLPGSMRNITHESGDTNLSFTITNIDRHILGPNWLSVFSRIASLITGTLCFRGWIVFGSVGGDVMIFISPEKEYIMFLTGDLPGVF